MEVSIPRAATLALFLACTPMTGCGPRLLPPSDYLGEWRTGRGDPGRTGSVEPDLRPPLEAAWRKRVGRGMKGAPVPVGPLLLTASTDGRVRALLRDTGEEAWSTKIRGGFFAAPAVANRRIYAASEYPDGALYCIGLERGDLLWRRKTGPVRSTPTVDGGVVYIVTDDGGLDAYDAVHGRRLWRVDAGALLPQSPLVFGDTLWLLTRGDSLRVLSTTDGRVLSTRPLGHHPLRAEVAARDGVAYYASADGIVALPGAGTGGEGPPMGGRRSFHVATAGGLLLGSDGLRTAFAVLPPATDALWTHATGGLLEAAPIVAGRHAVLASLAGEVRVLDLRDGRVLWKTRVDAPVPAPPAVSGGWLFVPLETGEVAAFRSRPTPPDGEAR